MKNIMKLSYRVSIYKLLKIKKIMKKAVDPMLDSV